MSKSTPTGLNTSGTTDAQISGPHFALDASGDGYKYYRCTGCGLESSDPSMTTRGCPRCNDE